MATLIPARLDQPITVGIKPKASTFTLAELREILGCRYIEVIPLPKSSVMGATMLVIDEEGKLKKHVKNMRASVICQFPTTGEFRAAVASMSGGVMILGEMPPNPNEPVDYIAGDALACFANELE